MVETPHKKITDENIGSFIELFSAKSGIDGQDGGMVSALLIWGMKMGVFDSAVVVQRKEGCDVEAVAVRGIDGIMAARGTKYFKVNILPKLKELLSQGSKRVGVVCTPCQVRAARKMQEIFKHDSSDVEITVIGLFCLEAFNCARLKSEIKRLLGVEFSKAEKNQIRKGRFSIQLGEKEYSCRVSDLRNAVEKGCFNCRDFSAKLADISVGSVGSQRGYSTVIVRSEKGKALLIDMDIEKTGVENAEIQKLSKFKKERAEKRASRLLRGNDNFARPS